MSKEPEDIFSKVSDDEKLRLFKDLATVRGDIVCKGESDEIYRLNGERLLGKLELQCSVPFGFNKPEKEKEILGNFFIGGERYFFKTPVRINHDLVVLRIDTDLFHLQRRQNYRIRIPDTYQAQFLITAHNKAPAKLSAQVLDLSSGGCRVALMASSPTIEMEDRIDGYLVIGKRESVAVECIVRHHKAEKHIGTMKQVFGLEFRELSSLVEGKIFAITLDLHREFFSRLSGKG